MKKAVVISILFLIIFIAAPCFGVITFEDIKDAAFKQPRLELGVPEGPQGLFDSAIDTAGGHAVRLSVANAYPVSYRPELTGDFIFDFKLQKDAPYAGQDILDAPSSAGELLQAGAAFLTNLFIHEIGHAVVADYAGARGNNLAFFTQSGDKFFLGMSSVEHIDDDAWFPYTMGGEFFTDLTFEHALREFRKSPNMYNRSLLLFSGLDFLWYCMYSFYLTNGDPGFDPVSISEQTGLSGDQLVAIAAAKTALNALRVYSGVDSVVPYFSVNSHAAFLNLAFPLSMNGCELGLCR
jgi:hypothetical protein